MASTQSGSESWGLEVVLDGVHERYCGRWALDGISFEVAPGEVVAITDPPAGGAGALLRLIASAGGPQQGEIRLVGQAALQAIDWELFKARSIAHLRARDWPLASLSVQGNLEGPLMGAHRDWYERRERVTAAMESFGLAHLGRTLAGCLDLRTQDRVRLATALITRPRLLLVDRPPGPAAQTQLEDVLEMHAHLRAVGREPTVIVAGPFPPGRVQVQRTIEIPHRAIARTPRAVRRARKRAAALAGPTAPEGDVLRSLQAGASR